MFMYSLLDCCNVEVHDEKTDYSGVESRAGANDNLDHVAGGGTTKVHSMLTIIT